MELLCTQIQIQWPAIFLILEAKRKQNKNPRECDGLLSKVLKFIYSEKATKFCEISTLLLSTVHTVKSYGKISQNFVAFSEYMNFNTLQEF